MSDLPGGAETGGGTGDALRAPVPRPLPAPGRTEAPALPNVQAAAPVVMLKKKEGRPLIQSEKTSAQELCALKTTFLLSGKEKAKEK